MNGGRIFMPRAFFTQSDPRQPLRLSHPQIAGIFAHELLHQWQRLQGMRSEEHTSELQSQSNLVCRLLLEKKKIAERANSSAYCTSALSATRSEKTSVTP